MSARKKRILYKVGGKKPGKVRESGQESADLPPETPVDTERRAMGRVRDGARFTAPPPAGELPENYGETLANLKDLVRQARLKAVLAANSTMVLAYWDMGRTILQRQAVAGWGAKVIDRLSADLRQEFPDMQGLSPRNLHYMRAFAAAWPDRAIVQGTLAQITWYQNIALLERMDAPELRLWYAREAAVQGWSQPILCMQIERQAHARQGKAVTNFPATLPPADSAMAAQVFKDPYLFDFLGTADPRREREVEQALVDHIQRFLLELGAGFAFVGRQVHLEVGTQDYYLDLIFYHLKLRRFVVVELKAVPFDPGFAGKMNLYLSAVDDLLRHPDDQPSIGLLLCRSKDKLVVEYALRDIRKPIGVAEWETTLVRSLPRDLKSSLPTVKDIEAALALR
jgi:predicted nuclease of restriction endonuclease-like (RecB) superfamily